MAPCQLRGVPLGGANQQTTESYIQVMAASKLHEEFPDMLFINTGKAKKCPISVEGFNALTMKLRKWVLQNMREPEHSHLQTHSSNTKAEWE
jgi:hypothetical protein